jgi:hypothetical protein
MKKKFMSYKFCICVSQVKFSSTDRLTKSALIIKSFLNLWTIKKIVESLLIVGWMVKKNAHVLYETNISAFYNEMKHGVQNESGRKCVINFILILENIFF